MTATLAAKLVDEGRIRWDSTVGDVLGSTEGLLPEWRGVTLEQLLQHRSGAPETPPADLWATAWKQAGTPAQQRGAFVQGLLSRSLQAPPGSKFLYSNQGYTIAGTMLERVTGTPWERLITDRVFKPLGMKSAGFGAPGSPGKADQPLGHRGQTSLTPVEIGPAADNPPAIGPAGIVHCSISDLARYAGWHATGTVPSSPGLSLKPETFARLHQPANGGDYAMGWGVTKRDWAGGTALTHNGSNTMWFTVIWVSPAKHAAFVAATNAASESAPGACDAAVSQLIQRLLK
jgi:CubicO group peptidase (beta-lactamase class C family)